MKLFLKTGSLGSILLTYCNEKHILRTFEHIALADHYSKQGSVQEIYDDEKIDLDTVINKCEELMNGKKRIDVLLVEQGFFDSREKAKNVLLWLE